ncbi:MAG: hypothetical protein ACYCPH_01455 [Minisyncoccota bacterium]
MQYSFLAASALCVAILIATLIGQIRKGVGFGMALRQPLSAIFGILFVVFLGLFLSNVRAVEQSGTPAGGAQSGTPSSTVARPTTLPGNISLARLESLTNYSFTQVTNGGGRSMTISGNVYDANNWEMTAPWKVIHIGTQTYTNLGKWYLSHQSYAPPLSGFAEQFWGMASNPTLRLREDGGCHFANTAGHVWTVVSANGNAENIVPMSACIADQSGALLQSVAGLSNALSGNKNLGDSFTITSIGTVQPIPAPSPVVSG